MEKRILDEDLVRIHGSARDRFELEDKHGRVVDLLFWGDEVQLVDPDQVEDPGARKVDVLYHDHDRGELRKGYIRKRREQKRYQPLRFRSPEDPRPLSITFVDFGGSDATWIRTPHGRHILLDGGQGVPIARLLASRFPGTTQDEPLIIDALVATHGDAVHYSGLVRLAEAAEHPVARKRLHVRLARFFHNGLVKLPEKLVIDGERRLLKERERFGACIAAHGRHFVTELWDDPRAAPSANEGFRHWSQALDGLLASTDEALRIRGAPGEQLPIVRRIAAGEPDAFGSFRDEGMFLSVLGPHSPAIGERHALEVLIDAEGDESATRTHDGHTVVLHLRYGALRFLLGAPVDPRGAERLLAYADLDDASVELTAELLKLHHHGEREVSESLLGRISPLVTILTSGDTSRMGVHAHPRADLVAAVGRASRMPGSALFLTQRYEQHVERGGVRPERYRETKSGKILLKGQAAQRGFFHARERTRFGTVRACTDGKRLIVAPYTSSDRIEDAHAFELDEQGAARKIPLRIL